MRPRAALLAPLLCVLTVVAACGAPQWNYVTNSADRTYVKIPADWKPVDGKDLDAVFGIDPAQDAADLGIWHAAYDAAPDPTTEHLVGWSATAPIALVSVRQVPAAERGRFSLDGLRDTFLPVSTTARMQLAADPFGGGLQGFALVTDEVLTPGTGVHGVHSVYRYGLGTQLQTIDQTVYVNDDASTVYMFFVRCSTTCYADRHEEIERVVSSFTVRGDA